MHDPVADGLLDFKVGHSRWLHRAAVDGRRAAATWRERPVQDNTRRRCRPAALVAQRGGAAAATRARLPAAAIQCRSQRLADVAACQCTTAQHITARARACAGCAGHRVVGVAGSDASTENVAAPYIQPCSTTATNPWQRPRLTDFGKLGCVQWRDARVGQRLLPSLALAHHAARLVLC